MTDFVAPFGPAKISRDWLVVFGVEKGIGRKRRRRKQDRHREDLDGNAIFHAANPIRSALDTARKNPRLLCRAEAMKHRFDSRRSLILRPASSRPFRRSELHQD